MRLSRIVLGAALIAALSTSTAAQTTRQWVQTLKSPNVLRVLEGSDVGFHYDPVHKEYVVVYRVDAKKANAAVSIRAFVDLVSYFGEHKAIARELMFNAAHVCPKSVECSFTPHASTDLKRRAYPVPSSQFVKTD